MEYGPAGLTDADADRAGGVDDTAYRVDGPRDTAWPTYRAVGFVVEPCEHCRGENREHHQDGASRFQGYLRGNEEKAEQTARRLARRLARRQEVAHLPDHGGKSGFRQAQPLGGLGLADVADRADVELVFTGAGRRLVLQRQLVLLS